MKKLYLIFLLLLSLKLNLKCNGRKIVLLLGALHDSKADYMSHLKNELLKENKGLKESEKIEIIDGIEINTFKFTIEEQADVVHKFLKEEKKLTNKDEIVVIGHSQGGLRGYALYKKYNKELNITALFTLASPWGGAQILESATKIKKKLSNYKEFAIQTPYIEEFKHFLKNLELLEVSPGVLDMRVGEKDLSTALNARIFSDFPSYPSPLFAVESYKHFPRLYKKKIRIEENNIENFFKKMSSYEVINSSIRIYCLAGSETDIFKSSFLPFPDIKERIYEIQSKFSNFTNNSSLILNTAGIFTFAFDMFNNLFSSFTGNSNLTIDKFQFTFTEHLINLNEVIKALENINKIMCKYIGSNVHDGVLSLKEQFFNESIKKENIFVDNFLIKDAFHGPISNPNEIFLEKAIYNHTESLKYIKEKIKLCFSIPNIDKAIKNSTLESFKGDEK